MSTKQENWNGSTSLREPDVTPADQRRFLNDVCTSLTSYLDQVQSLRSRGSSPAEIENSLRQLELVLTGLILEWYLTKTIGSAKDQTLDIVNGVQRKESPALSKELYPPNG